MRGLRLAVLAVAVLFTDVVPAATASLAVDSRSIHAGMPFTLTLTAGGFEKDPAPAAPDLAIDGCTVTYLGVSPSVATRITIVNGRRTEARDVTFRFRWRVLAPSEGNYRVPPLEVVQGGLVARTPAASFEAASVPDTPDMIVRMQLPEDGVYEGETFDAAVDWLIARNAESFEFVVPLFDLEGAEVEAAPGTGRTVRFVAGASEVDLPMERADEVVHGQPYTRFRFPARVTLARPGSFDLGPVQALAQLQAGESRDSFGFRRPQYQLFRAAGRSRRLDVRPLPIAGRPASFVNAIGGGFSIDVQASRTVVNVGDPVELTVEVRGDAPLEGLSLPPLGGPEGLPADHFSVPEGSVAGRIDPERNTKTFVVTVRVRSAEAREIPPIAFSWFDPAAHEYRTAKSRPIALSVDASETVGAGDVVAAATSATPTAEQSPTASRGGAREGSAMLTGADMSLSDPDETLARPWGTGRDPVLLGTLYGGPVIVLLVAWWLTRTGERRTRRRAIRAAVRELDRALASGAAARDASPAIASAMRRLADATGADRAGAAAPLARLETRAFDPRASGSPVADEVIEELRAIARGWTRDAQPGGASSTAAVLAGAVAAGAAGLPTGETVAADGAELEEARSLHAQALDEADRERRVRLFGAAERAFRPIAQANPFAPGVQTDWGNAALGAQDAGRAVLAYRRALRAAPGDARARANLAWLRSRMPAWLPRPSATGGAVDSLFFWRGMLNPDQFHLAGAGAFAVGLLLLAGGLLGARRRVRILAVPVLAVWAVAAASAWTSRPTADDAVVVTDGSTLRSADSAGATPALVHPLPAGAEVAIVERRDEWARVRLADGTTGWLAASTLLRVSPGEGMMAK